MGRKDDAFGRETLADRVAYTRGRQTGTPEATEAAQTSTHGTAGFHSSRPQTTPASWAAPPVLPPSPASPAPLVRHCWYLSPSHGRLPALFLRWRHTGNRHYDGFICTITLDETGTWCLTELWVDSAMLEPA
jgi:hypothetical protein